MVKVKVTMKVKEDGQVYANSHRFRPLRENRMELKMECQTTRLIRTFKLVIEGRKGCKIGTEIRE